MPEIVGRIPGVKEYKFPQSPSYPEVPLNPFRLCIASSTVGGKTTNILNMCLISYIDRKDYLKEIVID